ncbi:GntR family transcriptional regulator [Paraburkholderia phytofirmans]|jgi:DNA-binding GntR family transcriptional regulator|uniref:GntR family transcriptional regulator n=1 Tax=Paraburkholderia sp. BL9I2N2 TaxID=1938809 RepID=UPI001044773C|nr:GntR family transcriptional regulator [Paraburkholderia sp. BL9I2N2]TCK88572.1 GntR family transcriptional regulator [Paraburkholderia sp. BL9I2N2]
MSEGAVPPEHGEDQLREMPVKAQMGRALARRESMHVAILEQLRLDIVEGRWQAGERLPEPLLCEEFGVSRTPLRDAFRILETEGLVELIPHVGAVVTEPDASDINGAFEVLSLLEAAAAETVARNRPHEVLRKLRKVCELMQIALEKGNHRRYFELNDDFHSTIVEGASNPILRQTHEHLMWHVYRIRHTINRRRPFSREAGTGEEHQEIMQAILEGDSARAFALARSHLLGVGAATLNDAGLTQSEVVDEPT